MLAKERKKKTYNLIKARVKIWLTHGPGHFSESARPEAMGVEGSGQLNSAEALGHLIRGRGWRRGTVMLIKKGCSSETRQNENELLLWHRLVSMNKSLFLRLFVFVFSFESFISISFQICPWLLNKERKSVTFTETLFSMQHFSCRENCRRQGLFVCLLIHSFMHVFLHSLKKKFQRECDMYVLGTLVLCITRQPQFLFLLEVQVVC